MDANTLDLSDLVTLKFAKYIVTESGNGEMITLSASLKEDSATEAILFITQKFTRDLAGEYGRKFMTPTIHWVRGGVSPKIDSALVQIELLRLAYKLARFMDGRSGSILEDYPFPDPMITGKLTRMNPVELKILDATTL